MEIACDDERERAGAGVGAEDGEDFAVFAGEAAPGDEVDGVEDERRVGAAFNLHGDGAAGNEGACADGADRATSDEDADASAGAVASAWGGRW